MRSWLHPSQIGQDPAFQDHLDAQAVTGIKLLGALLVSLAIFAQVILRTLYLAETVKTVEGMLLSFRFLILGLFLLGSLRLPILHRIARPLLFTIMCILLADTIHLQIKLLVVHRAQLGLFISALLFIAFTFLPYRPWVVGVFGLYGVATILVVASRIGREINPYADTGVFWFGAQFLSLAMITLFFRAANLNMQISMHSMKEDMEDIKSILSRAESQKVEFKSSFRYDYKQKLANTEISSAVIKAIAGFLNTDGGTLILGVDDNGRPVGLEKDYLTLKKKSADGYEMSIIQAVSEACGADVCQNLRFSFLLLVGKEVCIVRMRSWSKPVYVELRDQSVFHIRTGNSTQGLDTKRAVEYIQSHWKKGRA